MKQVAARALNVGYADAGPSNGRPVILLHGWPYDIHSFVDVVPLLASAGYRVIVPYLRGCGTTSFLSSDTLRNGQQSALALDVIALMDALGIEKANFPTERGERGYSEYRRDFSKLIWRLASPDWQFDESTFDRTARSFDNPDRVRIVVHNYRWRLELEAGEPHYDAFEAVLAKAPAISVRAVTLQGDADGAPHPDSRAYAKKFSGPYAHRLVTGGVGHNLPQEVPRAFCGGTY